MSGSYVIHCGCSESSEYLDRTQGETLEILVKFLPEFEAMVAAGLELEDIRGTVFDPTNEAIQFLLKHWRHGTLEYTYSNNSKVVVPLVIPAKARLPEPCGVCHGRRLIPCPEC